MEGAKIKMNKDIEKIEFRSIFDIRDSLVKENKKLQIEIEKLKLENEELKSNNLIEDNIKLVEENRKLKEENEELKKNYKSFSDMVGKDFKKLYEENKKIKHLYNANKQDLEILEENHLKMINENKKLKNENARYFAELCSMTCLPTSSEHLKSCEGYIVEFEKFIKILQTTPLNEIQNKINKFIDENL